MADFNKFIKGFETPKEENLLGGEFDLSDKYEGYEDGRGAKSWAERDLNVMADNDEGIYNYLVANRKALAEKAKTDPKGVYEDIVSKSKYKDFRDQANPKSIRKSFLNRILTEGWEE